MSDIVLFSDLSVCVVVCISMCGCVSMTSLNRSMCSPLYFVFQVQVAYPLHRNLLNRRIQRCAYVQNVHLFMYVYNWTWSGCVYLFVCMYHHVQYRCAGLDHRHSMECLWLDRTVSIQAFSGYDLWLFI